MSRLAATKLQALPPFPKVISLKYFVRLWLECLDKVTKQELYNLFRSYLAYLVRVFCFSKALLGVCLEGWGTYLLAHDRPAQAAQLLSRALNISKEVLGEDHEQVGTVGEQNIVSLGNHLTIVLRANK